MKALTFAAALFAASATLATAQTATTNNPLRRPAATTSAPAASAPATQESAAVSDEKPKRRAQKAKAKSTGDYAERRKRCSAEWAAAKAANTTGGKKWPQFFSACNTRLKSAGV